MATIKFKGSEIHTLGKLPEVGSTIPDFNLLDSQLSEKSKSDFTGKRLIMNIFPSLDTETCANSVRNFNERATQLNDITVLCISRDTPFAQKRFLNQEQLDNVTALSDVRNGSFGQDYSLSLTDGPLKGFHSRAVIVADENGKVLYTEQVEEITEEPDYLSALKVLV
jgi:thiol peroxidase